MSSQSDTQLVALTQNMLHQSVVYYEPEHSGYPLHITANRYWLPALEEHNNDPDALTLILLHSTSFHKETWEPTLEAMLSLAARRGKGAKIREAWAIDCPNHGVSAVLNEEALQQPEFLYKFSCEKYAHAVHHFLSAGPDHGAKVDFSKRKLLGIGHSLGSVALTILQHLEPVICFSSIVLVEPMLSPAGAEFLYPLRLKLVRSAYERRDVWRSREAAEKYIHEVNKLSPTRWDDRVVDLFVKFAIREHPGSKHPIAPYNGVTLACTREQEATMYRDVEGPTKPVKDLDRICHRIPVHIILGGIKDYLPRNVHEAVIDPKSGRRFASITHIKNVGHLIPQQVPDKLAQIIFDTLFNTTIRPKL